MVLSNVKAILDIYDGSKDVLLDIYIKRAEKAIKTYLNRTDISPSVDYEEAVIEITVNLYNARGIENVTSESQGQRSRSYSDSAKQLISDSVKSLLPQPFVKLMG